MLFLTLLRVCQVLSFLLFIKTVVCIYIYEIDFAFFGMQSREAFQNLYHTITSIHSTPALSKHITYIIAAKMTEIFQNFSDVNLADRH